MKQPTPYPDLNHVLTELVTGIQAALADNFLGAYLQGSFAVGDFDEHSDVDFIVVTREALAGDQVAGLQALHGRIYDLPIQWAKHLEGSYFPQAVLRDYRRCGENLWYLDHGSREMIESDHCNTELVRWVVREWGIPLAGGDPADLIDPIPVEALRKGSMRVVMGWGQQVVDDPSPYNNQFYQQYLVQNFSRMLHDLIRGCPGSKRAGTEWAKSALDPKWIGLIDRSWAGRGNAYTTFRTPADPAEMAQTVNFVQAVMDEASKRYTMEGIER